MEQSNRGAREESGSGGNVLGAILNLAHAKAVSIWNERGFAFTGEGWRVPSDATITAHLGMGAGRRSRQVGPDDEHLDCVIGEWEQPFKCYLYVPLEAEPSGMLLGLNSQRGVVGPANLPSFAQLVSTVISSYSDRDGRLATAEVGTLREIVSGVAHDVGTPLNVISGYAEYLLMGSAADAPGRKEIMTILDQTRRTAQMLRQMLELTRPERPPRRRTQPVDEFLRELVELSSFMLRKASVRVTVAEGDAFMIEGWLPRLEQAMFILLKASARCIGTNGYLTLEARIDDTHGRGLEIAGRTAADEPVDLALESLEVATDALERDKISLAEELLEPHIGLHALEPSAGATGARCLFVSIEPAAKAAQG